MLKTVYALVGGDLFLQLEAMAKLVRQAGAEAHRIDVDGETAELATVLDELRTFSMFGGNKVVVVREAGDFIGRYRDALEKFIEHWRAGGGTLVFRVRSLPKTQRIYKLIEKTGQIIVCEAPERPGDLAAWAAQRAKAAHGLELTGDGAQQLAELIGRDLGRMDNELAKLALRVNGGKADAALVTSSASFQREQEMKALTMDLSAGQFAQAISRWRQLLQTDPTTEFRALVWLTLWLEDVRAAVAEPPRFQKFGWKYRNDPAGLQRFTQSARAIGADGLARLMHLLAQVDYLSKSGVGDMLRNVEMFLLSVAGQQARA
jgi:DNA polymerase III delta subunit